MLCYNVPKQKGKNIIRYKEKNMFDVTASENNVRMFTTIKNYLRIREDGRRDPVLEPIVERWFAGNPNGATPLGVDVLFTQYVNHVREQQNAAQPQPRVQYEYFNERDVNVRRDITAGRARERLAFLRRSTRYANLNRGLSGFARIALLGLAVALGLTWLPTIFAAASVAGSLTGIAGTLIGPAIAFFAGRQVYDLMGRRQRHYENIANNPGRANEIEALEQVIESEQERDEYASVHDRAREIANEGYVFESESSAGTQRQAVEVAEASSEESTRAAQDAAEREAAEREAAQNEADDELFTIEADALIEAIEKEKKAAEEEAAKKAEKETEKPDNKPKEDEKPEEDNKPKEDDNKPEIAEIKNPQLGEINTGFIYTGSGISGSKRKPSEKWTAEEKFRAVLPRPENLEDFIGKIREYSSKDPKNNPVKQIIKSMLIAERVEEVSKENGGKKISREKEKQIEREVTKLSISETLTEENFKKLEEKTKDILKKQKEALNAGPEMGG